MTSFRINTWQILIGAVSLCVGTLIYLSDRSPDSTYFVREFTAFLSMHDRFPDLFGVLDRSLASFLHVFSFIMITGGLFATTFRGYLAVSLGWLAVDTAFEAGQYFDAQAVNLVPEWFRNYPFLEATRTYFLNGWFDPMDVVAIVAGAVAGLLVLETTQRKTGERKQT